MERIWIPRLIRECASLESVEGLEDILDRLLSTEHLLFEISISNGMLRSALLGGLPATLEEIILLDGATGYCINSLMGHFQWRILNWRVATAEAGHYRQNIHHKPGHYEVFPLGEFRLVALSY